ncbi:MAG: ribonuclease HII [Candidatus Aenigmarchaeota archaeon]|nr:ribonuclease HII [Candidatus Aenigmarchaeota archaeon]
MIIGIDEAGRGPVIGPMVISGVQIKEKDEKTLKDLEVKDSKLLSPKRREELYTEIKKTAENIKTITIDAKTIDDLRKTKTLNVIELEAFADIINSLDAKTVFLDLPEHNSDFAERLKAKVNRKIDLTAEHKADERYPVVSAASIIAKVTRDKKITDIEKEAGEPIGSGYPSDPQTKMFLKTHYKENKSFPAFVRHSWETVKRIKDEKKQSRLPGF